MAPQQKTQTPKANSASTAAATAKARIVDGDRSACVRTYVRRIEHSAIIVIEFQLYLNTSRCGYLINMNYLALTSNGFCATVPAFTGPDAGHGRRVT